MGCGGPETDGQQHYVLHSLFPVGPEIKCQSCSKEKHTDVCEREGNMDTNVLVSGGINYTVYKLTDIANIWGENTTMAQVYLI